MTDYLEQSGELTVLRPGWPAPRNVKVAVSTRIGGVSLPPYDSLNLGDHVGDQPAAVAENRRRLKRALHLPKNPAWLQQVHGTRAVFAGEGEGCEADAVHTDRPGSVCAVLTADCLPVLFCSRDGTRIAAVHAGWRGLQAGILESTLKTLETAPENILAWLGPAIGPTAFEVGPEVRNAFLGTDPVAEEAFRPSPSGRWFADIYGLARRRLESAGIGRSFGGGFCTYSDAEHFYSFRRDGVTGRMATLIWMER